MYIFKTNKALGRESYKIPEQGNVESVSVLWCVMLKTTAICIFIFASFFTKQSNVPIARVSINQKHPDIAIKSIDILHLFNTSVFAVCRSSCYWPKMSQNFSAEFWGTTTPFGRSIFNE